MPTDSGGNYTLPSGSVATTGTTILASELNTPLNDIASALSARLPVDGSKGMSGVLKVSDGSAANPSIAFGSDTATGFYKKAPGVLGYSAAGTDTPLTVPAGVMVPFGGIIAPAGWLRADGSAVSRTTYAALFTALTATGNATKDGTTDVLNSVDTDFTSYGLVGAYVEGTGIASGTTIVSLTSSTITLSAIPTGSGAIAIRILPHGQGDASTTFNVPDAKGRVIAGRETSATRLTSAVGGVDGSVLGGAGASQSKTLVTANLPPYTPAGTLALAATAHITITSASQTSGGSGVVGVQSASSPVVFDSLTGTFTGTAQGGTSTAFGVVQPTLVVNYIIKT